MSEGKTKELVVDMPESGEMRSEALRMAKLVTENNKVESKIAEIIKKHFDEKYGPNWHCIVGRKSGSEFQQFLIEFERLKEKSGPSSNKRSS